MNQSAPDAALFSAMAPRQFQHQAVVDQACRFHFRDRWLIAGKRLDVATILKDPLQLPKWWPCIRRVRLHQNGEHRCGFSTLIKGFLPYQLHLDFQVVRAHFPACFTVRIDGDFIGTGAARLSQRGRHVQIDFDLTVSIVRRSLRSLFTMLRSFGVLQHKAVMGLGAAGLARQVRELTRLRNRGGMNR